MVISSNQSQIKNDSKRYIKMTFPSASGGNQKISVKNGKIKYDNTKLKNIVKSGKSYTTKLNYDNNGYVNFMINKVTNKTEEIGWSLDWNT